MTKKINKFLYWTPRILSILLILLLVLMSSDVISSELSFGEIVLGLFMHNIPAIILLIILIISWKYEIVGGIGFLLAGFLYVMLIAFRSTVAWYIALSWIFQLAVPAFLIGILFLVNWYKKKKVD